MAGRIELAYQGARQAFRSPMLALLHRSSAPLVVALLGSVFTPERARVPVADAHTEIGDALTGLRAAGYDGIPDQSARELCRSWVQAGWLATQVDENNVEVYRLTANAVGALEIAGRVGGTRVRVSKSRVRTLLDAIDRLAQDADPNVANRVTRLRQEIREREAELARLASGEQPSQVGDEQLIEEAENVLALIRELPADFARVAESIKVIQRETLAQLRADLRPAGEIIRDYLDRATHLMDATAEGRAYAGALTLIAEPGRLDELSDSLETTLRHGFASALATPDRAALRGVTALFERGIDDVNSAQRQATRVITTQVTNHDPLRDREVDGALRDAFAALHDWFPTSRRSQPVPPLRRLPRTGAEVFRTTMSRLETPLGPEELAISHDDDAGSLAEALAWGGPNYGAIMEMLAGADDGAALAELFDTAPETARRPVDFVGLLEFAARAELEPLGEVAQVTAIRPDGTKQTLIFEDGKIIHD